MSSKVQARLKVRTKCKDSVNFKIKRSEVLNDGYIHTINTMYSKTMIAIKAIKRGTQPHMWSMHWGLQRGKTTAYMELALGTIQRGKTTTYMELALRTCQKHRQT